jgi:zinc protease
VSLLLISTGLFMKPNSICLALALAFGAATTLSGAPVLAASAKAVTPAKAVTSVEGITEYRLANGLRVLLAPDASKPSTTVNVTYLVGSRHESYGETGMAHLLEHLVFKGTKTRGDLIKELGKRGMQFNGTTFYDRTNYYETFSANDDSLKWALEMEADRMINSKIARSDLDTEFSVVRNEMEIGENNPIQTLWKQLTAVTFDWHNYGNNTIGARSDVEGVKIDNLQAFYRKFYQPDNAVLMVAGKFDPVKTLALIQASFGVIPKPTRALSGSWTKEPPRDGTREVTVRRVGDQQVALLLYPTSAGSHPDGAAMEVVSDILAAKANGRLHKKLVETKQAVAIGHEAFQLAEPGYAMFLAFLSKDQDMAQAKKTMIATLEETVKQPFSEEELKRSKTNLLNELEKTINDPQRLCVAMSESIALGDWRMFFVQRDRIEALTLADAQRAAQNYFKEDNRSFGQFLPVATPDRAQIPATPDVAKVVDGYKGRVAVAAGETFDATPANIDKRTEKSTLANGAKLALLSKKTRGETVVGQLALHMGDEKSLFGLTAIADLTNDMLLRGSSQASRAQLETKLGELKAKVTTRQQGQALMVDFETVRANLIPLLDVLRDVLRAPVFPQSEFDLLVKENLAQAEAGSKEPQTVASDANNAKRNAPYKKGDIRYTENTQEVLASYAAANLAGVKDFYQRFYGASHAELTLVGDFDAAAVKAKLATVIGDWKSPTAFVRAPKAVLTAAGASQTFETADKANAFYLAELPLNMNDQSADYPAFLVANNILGTGSKSRLFDRLRQKEGISYGVGSQLSVPSLDSNASLNLFALYAPQNLAKLQASFKDELERFVKDGVTADELAQAKQALSQSRAVRRAQDADVARTINNQVYLGRSMAFDAALDSKIAALTLEQVNAAIRQYFKPENIAHYYAGDFAGAAKKAAK